MKVSKLYKEKNSTQPMHGVEEDFTESCKKFKYKKVLLLLVSINNFFI